MCYIPELATEDDEPITRNYIVVLCGGDEVKAEMVFAMCTWEHPATIIDQWDDEDEKILEEIKKERL